jgi:heme a synthase
LPDCRAGLIYNTWPLIEGGFVPDAARLLHDTPAWRNLFENTLMVQFNHRMVAYALLACAAAHAIDAVMTTRRAAAPAIALATAVALQAVLGILTLLWQVPIGLSLLHQAGAIVVLALAVFHAQRVAVKQSSIRIVESAAMR